MDALRWLAKAGAGSGVFAIVLLAADAQKGPATQLMAGISFLALMLGSVSLFVIQYKDTILPGNRLASNLKGEPSRRSKSTATIAIVIIVGLLVQTRFRVGTVLAWGDFQPPEGTAWLGHIFSGWSWTGNNLGTLSNSVTVLPWAMLVEVVHLLGGSAGLAQRIWFTTLLVLVGLVVCGLLLAFEFSAVSSVIGGLVYVFNPFMMTVSKVLSPGAISGMILPPFFLWWVVMASRDKRISVWLWISLALSATLLGYSYQTPPLAGAAMGCFLFGPVLVEVLYRDRKRTFLAVQGMVKGLAVLVALSAYWIIPAVVQLWYGVVAIGRLDTLSWVSNESRATIANGFWLNSVPLWHMHIYYSFSSNYNAFPLSFLKWILPIAAFSSLALAAFRGAGLWKQTYLPALVSLSALLVLVVILLSTGTRSPGGLLFDFLYRLPFGWLLQVPIRFLYLAGLGYSILVAALIEAFWHSAERYHERLGRLFDEATFLVAIRWVGSAVFVVCLLVSVYPEVTGAIVPQHNASPGSTAYNAHFDLPSDHAKFPRYWFNMASYLNHSHVSGAVLILPPHSSYLVPRMWYYGNDGFIPAMISRPVIDAPSSGSASNSGSYLHIGQDLGSIASLISENLVTGGDNEVAKLLEAVDSPFVLVSGDVVSPFVGRSLINQYPSKELESALRADSLMKLVYQAGPLNLFMAKSFTSQLLQIAKNVVTVQTPSPNLATLQLFQANTVLVTGPVMANVPALYEVPLSSWVASKRNTMKVNFPLVPGRKYALGLLRGGKVLASGKLPRSGNRSVGGIRIRVDRISGRGVVLTFPSHEVFPESASLGRAWSAPGDCASSLGSKGLGGYFIRHGAPGGVPAFKLLDTSGSACISTAFSKVPPSGMIAEVSIVVKHVSGAPPRLCIWETNLNTCASLGPLPTSKTWIRFHKTVLIAPGVGSIKLFLYSDSNQLASQLGETLSSGSGSTVNEYSSPRVLATSDVNPVILESPLMKNSARSVLVFRTSYSRSWSGPADMQHVLVDGMENGWLFSKKSGPRSGHLPQLIHFGPGHAEAFGYFISLFGMVAGSIFVLSRKVRWWSSRL